MSRRLPEKLGPRTGSHILLPEPTSLRPPDGVRVRASRREAA